MSKQPVEQSEKVALAAIDQEARDLYALVLEEPNKGHVYRLWHHIMSVIIRSAGFEFMLERDSRLLNGGRADVGLRFVFHEATKNRDELGRSFTLVMMEAIPGLAERDRSQELARLDYKIQRLIATYMRDPNTQNSLVRNQPLCYLCVVNSLVRPFEWNYDTGQLNATFTRGFHPGDEFLDVAKADDSDLFAFYVRTMLKRCDDIRPLRHIAEPQRGLESSSQPTNAPNASERGAGWPFRDSSGTRTSLSSDVSQYEAGFTSDVSSERDVGETRSSASRPPADTDRHREPARGHRRGRHSGAEIAISQDLREMQSRRE